MNLPNILTILRIFLAPVFLIFFLMDDPIMKIISLCVVFLAELCDFFDGYIARKYRMVTKIGKIIDPLADSIFHFFVFIGFYLLGYAQLWMLVVIFVRSIFIAYLRWLATKQDRYISAKKIGKLKTAIQALAIVIIMGMSIAKYWWAIPHLQLIALISMGLVTIITAVSIIPYIKDNRDIFSKA